MNPNRQLDTSGKAPAIQPDQPSTLAHALLKRASWGQSVLSPWVQRWFKPGTRSRTGLGAAFKHRFLLNLITIQPKVLPGRPQHPVDQTPVQWPTRGILNPGRLDRFTSIIVNRFPVTKGKYERHQLEFRQVDSLPLILAGLDTEETPGDSEERGAESFETMLSRAESFESMLAKTGQAQQVTKKSGSVETPPPPTPDPQPAQIQRTSSRFETMLSRVKQGSTRSSRPDVSPPIAGQAPRAEAGPRWNDQPPPAAISKRAFSRIEELPSSDQASLVPEAKPSKPITHKLESPAVEESPPVGPMAAKPVIEPESNPGIAPTVQHQPTPEGLPQKSSDPAEALPVDESREGEAMSVAEPSQVAESPKQQQVQSEIIHPEPTAQSSPTKETSFEENDVKESPDELAPNQKATPKVQPRLGAERSERGPLVPPPTVDEPPVEETRLVKPSQESVVQRPPKPEISFRKASKMPSPTEEQATEGTPIVEPSPEPVAQRPPGPEILLREEPVLPGPTEEQVTEGTTIAESVPKRAIQRRPDLEIPQGKPSAQSLTVEPPAEFEPILGEEAEPPNSQAFATQRHVTADQKKEMPLRPLPTQKIGPEETQSLGPDEVVLEPGKGILAKVTSRWRLPLITSSRFTQSDLTEGRSPVQMTVLPQTHVARADESEPVAETPVLAARLPLPVPRLMKGAIPDGQKSDRDSLVPEIAQPAPPPMQHQPIQPMAAQPVTVAPPQESSGVIQRANGIDDKPVIQPATEEAVPDLDNLARQVYPLIKRMLAVERQRRSSR